MTNIRTEMIASSVVLTLDNPEALNALSPDMVEQLGSALADAGADRRCRAIVITGTGERAFCAGIDVRSVAARDEETTDADLDPIVASYEHLQYELGGIIRAIHRAPVPVVAAVNGHAIGAGFAIAAASDLRVIGDNVSFADGFVRRGISGCELGLSYFLPRLVGASRAFDWMLTGRRIDAAEAQASGLVGAVGPVETTLERALEAAGAFSEIAPFAVTMTKEVMWANLEASSLDQAMHLEARSQVMARNTADAGEARQAFLDKRSPEFSSSPRPRRSD